MDERELEAQTAHDDRMAVRAERDRLRTALAAAEQARDDFRDSTYEMLGEVLAAHPITPDPCPGGPCVANALLAIGQALTAAEAERDHARRELALQHGSFAAVVAERDEARQRATRLAVLEQAARALTTARATYYDLVYRQHTGPPEVLEQSARIERCMQAVDQAVAALAAPPGEGA